MNRKCFIIKIASGASSMNQHRLQAKVSQACSSLRSLPSTHFLCVVSIFYIYLVCVVELITIFSPFSTWVLSICTCCWAIIARDLPIKRTWDHEGCCLHHYSWRKYTWCDSRASHVYRYGNLWKCYSRYANGNEQSRSGSNDQYKQEEKSRCD